MNEKLLKEILKILKKELSLDFSDKEYMMYLEEKIEKAYIKEQEHNLSTEDFVNAIRNEIPTFFKNYQDMKKTFDKTAKDSKQRFGISINFELIDLFKIIDLCNSKEDFIKKKNDYFKKLANDPRFQGFDYIFPGLQNVSLDELKNIRKNILENVECLTPEWSGKMRMNIDTGKPLIINRKINEELFDFTYLNKIANFARENNMKMRMHNIIWHSQFPLILKNATREDSLKFLDLYMKKIYEQYSDVIYTVDVLNEIASDTPDKVLRDSPWKNLLDDEYYIDVLRLAKKIFKNIPLAYNEYGEERPEKRKNIIDIINKIKQVEQKENITLLDVIGIQSHYSNQTTDKSIKDVYRDYSKLGKEIQVTEFDVSNNGNNKKLDLQTNRIYRTVMGSAAAYGVKLINMWGISSKISWKSNKINNFLDENGNQTIYIQKILKTFSNKHKQNMNLNQKNISEKPKQL